MSAQPTFLLVEILEGGFVRRLWKFRASDEGEIARYLWQHAWEYDEVFRALRIHRKEVPLLTPEELLRRIQDSPITGRHDCSLYLLRVPDQEIRVDEAELVH
jgi:hypothetical protein